MQHVSLHLRAPGFDKTISCNKLQRKQASSQTPLAMPFPQLHNHQKPPTDKLAPLALLSHHPQLSFSEKLPPISQSRRQQKRQCSRESLGDPGARTYEVFIKVSQSQKLKAPPAQSHCCRYYCSCTPVARPGICWFPLTKVKKSNQIICLPKFYYWGILGPTRSWPTRTSWGAGALG